MQTAVLVLNQTNMLSLAAVADPMRAANRQAGRALYDWAFVTPDERHVSLTSGVILPARPIAELPKCDALIVAASFDAQLQSTPRLCASLRRLSQNAIVAGVDGGPWVLAQAGLLDGHRATVHWEDLDAFSASFPLIDVVNARHVSGATRLTCGGASPALDMMLDLIAAQHGSELSGRIAASFIHAPATSGLPQSRNKPHTSHNANTARAQSLMEVSLDEPVPLTKIAKQLGLSPRALQQQFQNCLGTTPQDYYLTLRLTEAHRQITQTETRLQDIAFATGFSSPASFARAFRRVFGITATELRRS
ncbi:MAG: helix-turn-helix domain-containing protein [Aliishimia sp.]